MTSYKNRETGNDRPDWCNAHPRVPASTACRCCHVPLCKACVHSSHGLDFCSNLCEANFFVVNRRQATLYADAQKKKLRHSLRRTAVVLAAIAVCAGALGYYQHTRHQRPATKTSQISDIQTVSGTTPHSTDAKVIPLDY